VGGRGKGWKGKEGEANELGRLGGRLLPGAKRDGRPCPEC